MEKADKIEIPFSPQETTFLEMIRKHCSENRVAEADYIKELVKKDLAWGFVTRKKRRDG